MSEAPISRRRAETQARLLDAAIGIFAERGVLAATVEEISDRAGFTRGAFYSNFNSKDDLVLALLQRDREANTVAIAGLASDEVRSQLTGELAEIMSNATAWYITTQDTRREWIMVTSEVGLYAARVPEIREQYLAWRTGFHGEVAEAMQLVVETYQLTTSMSVLDFIALLDPVYDSCMMSALMIDTGQPIDDVKQLPQEQLIEVLRPLTNLVSSWILTVGVLEEPASA